MKALSSWNHSAIPQNAFFGTFDTQHCVPQFYKVHGVLTGDKNRVDLSIEPLNKVKTEFQH